MSADNIRVSLYTADAASDMVAMIAAAQVGVPELKGALAASVNLLNTTLDWAANSVYAEIPSRKRQHHNGVQTHLAEKLGPGIEVEEDTWEPTSQLSVSRCKRLLLEILRRAAHDWILYRHHHKMGMRELAEDAYTWLFVEDEGHPNWKLRKGCKILTSFIAICEAMDFDPDQVRQRIKKMDIKTVISAGRPAESRRAKPIESPSVDECGLMLDVDVDNAPVKEEYLSQYEAYGSVMTPAVLYPSDSTPPPY